MNYEDYLLSKQGIFIMTLRQTSVEITNWNITRSDLRSEMRRQRSFEFTRANTQRPACMRHMRSLLIDIENTLVKKVELMNRMQLEILREQDNYETDFILVTLPIK